MLKFFKALSLNFYGDVKSYFKYYCFRLMFVDVFQVKALLKVKLLLAVQGQSSLLQLIMQFCLPKPPIPINNKCCSELRRTHQQLYVSISLNKHFWRLLRRICMYKNIYFKTGLVH